MGSSRKRPEDPAAPGVPPPPPRPPASLKPPPSVQAWCGRTACWSGHAAWRQRATSLRLQTRMCAWRLRCTASRPPPPTTRPCAPPGHSSGARCATSGNWWPPGRQNARSWPAGSASRWETGRANGGLHITLWLSITAVLCTLHSSGRPAFAAPAQDVSTPKSFSRSGSGLDNGAAAERQRTPPTAFSVDPHSYAVRELPAPRSTQQAAAAAQRDLDVWTPPEPSSSPAPRGWREKGDAYEHNRRNSCGSSCESPQGLPGRRGRLAARVARGKPDLLCSHCPNCRLAHPTAPSFSLQARVPLCRQAPREHWRQARAALQPGTDRPPARPRPLQLHRPGQCAAAPANPSGMAPLASWLACPCPALSTHPPWHLRCTHAGVDPAAAA